MICRVKKTNKQTNKQTKQQTNKYIFFKNVASLPKAKYNLSTTFFFCITIYIISNVSFNSFAHSLYFIALETRKVITPCNVISQLTNTNRKEGNILFNDALNTF